MIICSCNCLSECQLAAAFQPDIDSADKLYARLGCQLKCGKCVPYVQEIMMEQQRHVHHTA